MRTIRAELRTTPARQHGESAIRRPNRTADGMTDATLIKQMPRWKRQAVQVVDCRTCHDSRRDLSRGDTNRSLLRLSFDQEVGMIFEKLGHMCRRSSEEADSHA